MSTKNNPSINDKIIKLRELTAWFESEDFAIEQATDKFAAAEQLAAEIKNDLANAKNDINILKQKFDSVS